MSDVSAGEASVGCARDVCAVLVTYHPDPALLAAQLAVLVPQVGRVVIVDNASAEPALAKAAETYPAVELLALPVNVGLAAGMNTGIAHARGLAGIAHVLLLDQDSVPAADMVVQLVAGLARLTSHAKVAAVGPRFRDAREAHDAAFVRIRFPFNRKLHCDGQCAEIECDFLISSGCLISLAVLDAVGVMDESLFIDNVDLDWCFRATAAGYCLYGICAARLQHHLGDARQRVFGLPRGIVVHPPRRLYYMMRNRLLLYRRAHTPARWIAQDVPRLVTKLLLFTLVVAPRAQNLRAMLAGIREGLAGRATPPHG